MLEARSDSRPSGRECRMLKHALSIGAYALCVQAYQLLRACRLCSCRALELLSYFFIRESASPFIDEGDGLYKSKMERERVCMGATQSCCPRRRVRHTIAHLTVHDLLYLASYTVFAHLTVHDMAGCTMFAWDDKQRHPQYCLYSAASGRLYSVRLTWPNGIILQVRRTW